MTLNQNASTPLYIQIKDLLQQQIQSGVYAEGDRLPSERELSERYGVSRMTARQALQLLSQSGIVHAQVGKGTYVSGTQIDQELRELNSFTQEMGRRGMQPSSRVLNATTLIDASNEVVEHLQINAGAEIVLLQRVRLADGEPMALETAYLNHILCPGILLGHDFAVDSLYQTLNEQYDLHLVWATQVITARISTTFERTALGLRADIPVLGFTRVTYDEQDRPIEYVRSCYHGERFQLRTVLREIG